MINKKYSFLYKKPFISSFHEYSSHADTCCFIVRHPAHVQFVAQTIGKITKPICLASPSNAVAYMGVRNWLALIQETSYLLPPNSTHILDCCDHGGLAMAALRLGQPIILFDSASPQLKTIQERAASVQSLVITHLPVAFDLTEVKFTST